MRLGVLCDLHWGIEDKHGRDNCRSQKLYQSGRNQIEDEQVIMDRNEIRTDNGDLTESAN